jgi:hypothetical protein
MSDFDRLLGGFVGTRKAVADATDPTSLFRDATWSQVGSNKELTDFLQKSIDPDGSLYNGDVEALKSDLLNKRTRANSSVLESVADWGISKGESTQKKQFENLIGRLYEDAPNRLVSGKFNDTYQAVKAGVIGGVVVDLPLNVALTALTGGVYPAARVGLALKPVLMGRALGKEAITSAAARVAAGEAGAEGALKLAGEAAGKEAARAAGWANAKSEAISGAATGFAGDLAQQAAAVNRENQDEIHQLSALGNAAGGAVLGGALGGLTGRFIEGRGISKDIQEALPGVVGAEKTRLVEAAANAPVDFVGAPSQYAQLNIKLNDAAGDINEFLRLNLAGKAKSQYTPQQLVAIRDAVVRLKDSEGVPESIARNAEALRAKGDPESMLAANAEDVKILDFKRFAKDLLERDVGGNDLFNVGNEIDGGFVALLSRYDTGLASALGKVEPTAKPVASASPGTAAAATPEPVAAPAPAAAAVDPAAAAPTPTQEAAATPAAVPTGNPTAATIEELAPRFSSDEQAALTDLKAVLAKAGMDMDSALAAMEQVGQTQVIADVSKQAGVPRGTVRSAMQKVTAATTRERSKAAAPVESNSVATNSVAEATPIVNAPAAAAVPEPVAAAKVAPEGTAEQRIEAQLSDQFAAFSGTTHNLLLATAREQEAAAGRVADDVLARIDEANVQAEGNKLEKSAKVAIAKDVIAKAIQANPSIASVLSEADAERLITKTGAEKVMVRVAQAGRDSVAWTYAKAVGDILPDPLNVADFEVVMRALPGVPLEDVTGITNSYRAMVTNALAERIEAIGIDNLKRDPALKKAWDALVAGGQGNQPYGAKSPVKIDVGELVNGYASRMLGEIADDGGSLKDFAKGIEAAGGVVRDFMKSLQASGVPMDSQFMREALAIRASAAVDDVISGRFVKENAGDFDKIERLRVLRDAERAGVAQSTLRVSQGVVENPVLARVTDDLGVERFFTLTGRSQPTNGVGVRQLGKPQSALSDGISDYLGFLWANPRKVFAATSAARRAIYGAAVENATDARGTMVIDGAKRSGSMKMLKGLYAEKVQQRLEQNRFLNIMDAREKLINGSLSEEAYASRIKEIGDISGRPVQDYDVAVSQRMLDSQERIKSAMSIQRREVQEILAEAKSMGHSPTERLLNVLNSVGKVAVKAQGDLVAAMKTYETKAKSTIKGSAKAGEGEVKGTPASYKRAFGLDKDGLVVYGERDVDPVVVKVRGQSYELVPQDAISLTAEGDVTLFGKKIGTWVKRGTESDPTAGNSVSANINGIGPVLVDDATALIKRSSFRKQFAAEIEANTRKMTKTASTASDIAEGVSIPKESSNTEMVKSAQADINSEGRVRTDDLDRMVGSFDVGADRIVAFKMKESGRIVKLGLSSTEAGSTSVRAAMQRVGVDSIDEIEIGSLPAGKIKRDGEWATRTTQDWLLSNFRPLTARTGEPVKEVVKKMAADKPELAPTLLKASRRPISFDDAAKIKMADGRTLSEAAQSFESSIVGLQWSAIADLDSLNLLSAELSRVAAEIEAIAPHGLIRENASRRRSFFHMERVLSGVPEAERVAALDVLRRIDSDKHGLPYVYPGDTNAVTMGSGPDAGKSRMTLNPSAATGAPQHVVVAHEMGHWAFINMLSPSEQVQFVQSLAKYADADGKISADRVLQTMANAMELEKVTGKRLIGARSSTNELFAWQFSNWYMDHAVGARGLDAEESLWARVVTYTKNLLASFLGQKVDKDLEPLFERILPTTISERKFDYASLYDRSVGESRTLADIGDTELRGRVGSVIGVMEKIDSMRGKLAQMLFTPGGIGDATMGEELRNSASHVFGLLYGRNETKVVGGLRAKLNPVRAEGDWKRGPDGKVLKVNGKGVRETTLVEGAVDPKELFSRSETGKLMSAIRDVFPSDERLDVAENIAFEAAAGAEEFSVVMKAAGIQDNPEVALLYNQVLAREFKERMAAGSAEDVALDAAELAATREAVSYAKTEFGIDVGSNFFDDAGNRVTFGTDVQRKALGDVARKMFDLMSDAMDHLETEVGRFGFALQRNGREYIPAEKTSGDVAQEATAEKAVAAATKGKKKVVRVAPSTEDSAAVVAREESDRAIDGKQTGVPAGAPPLVKALIARVPHRDPEQQDIVQDLMYRLIAHAVGPDNMDRVTNGDISKLTGIALEDGIMAEADASSTTAAFDALRKTLRSASEDLTNHAEKPNSAIDAVVDIMSRIKTDAINEDLEASFTPAQVAKRAKDMLHKADLKDTMEMDGAVYEMLSEVGDVMSGLAKTSKARRQVSDEVVATAGRPIQARYEDGRYHPAFAKDDIAARLSSLPEPVGTRMLELIGVRAEPGQPVGKLLSNNIAFSTGGRSKTLLLSTDDVADALPAQSLTPAAKEHLSAIDSGIAEARASGDDAAMARLLAQRESLLGDAGDVTPYFVNMAEVFDPMAANQSQLSSALASFVKMLPKADLAPLQAIAQLGTSDPVRAMAMLKDAARGDANWTKVLKDSGFSGKIDDGTTLTTWKSPLEVEKIILSASEAGMEGQDLPLVGEVSLNYGLAGDGAKADPLAIEQRALMNGAPPQLAGLMAKFWKKNRNPDGLSPMEANEVRKLGPMKYFMEGSERIAKSGGEWLRDMIKPVEGTGFYEAMMTRLSSDLTPVTTSIEKLAGINNLLQKTGSEIKRNIWLRPNGEVPQTKIEADLVMAMNSNDITKLPREAQTVALELKRHMQKLLDMQREAGIDVGDVTGGDGFYLPRRFNVPWLSANYEEAVKRLAGWFQKDSGDTMALSMERAKKVVSNAINREELRGFMDMSNSTYAQAFGDKLYQRKLRVGSADWEGVAPLFDNNLKSLVISYTEAAHKRVEWSNRFGVKGHGANTYVNIADSGSVAAMDALMGSAQEIKYVLRSDDSLAGGANVEMGGNLFRPLSRTPDDAAQIVATIVGRLDADGKSAATRKGLVEYLVGLQASRNNESPDAMVHFSKRAEAIVNGLADFGDEGNTVAKHELQHMLKMVGTLGGRPAYTIDAGPGLRKAAGAVKTFNSVTLLAGATVSSFGDIGGSLIRSGSLSSWVKGLAAYAKASRSDPAYAAAQARVGAGIESILNENVANVFGGTGSKLSNALFWANGLTLWTESMRKASAMVGFESVKANQLIAQRERLAGNFDSSSYTQSMRYLRKLGLGYLVDEQPLPDFVKATEDMRVAEALHRFTNEAVFQPNRNDMPLWTQDPIAGMFWQFKSYPMMMQRMVKSQIKEAFHRENGKWDGDPSGLMYLLTIGSALGASSLAVKDYLYGKNQEADKENPGDDWRSLRERSLSRIAREFGIVDKEDTVMDNAQIDAALGWWAEGLLGLGALGFLGDLTYQSAKSLDNGAFGRERITSQILGPSLGTFLDGIQVVAGAMDHISHGDENGLTDERNAARKVLKRIPGVGSQDPWLEAWINQGVGTVESK